MSGITKSFPVALLIGLVAALIDGSVPEAWAASVPAGFTETLISPPNGGSWNEAVGVTFAAAGRMFVWERPGRVWFKDPGETNFTQLLDISEEVGDWGDAGCLGFAVDPQFQVNGNIYLLYVVDRHHLLYYGTGNYNSSSNLYNEATIGRLTRYSCTASNNFRSVNLASRTVLIGETKTNGIPLCSYVHLVGSLVFGQDGTLLVSTGDAASPEATDLGGARLSSYAPQALTDGIIRPKEDVGAFRSQLVDCLDGKVLRIDPATGNGLPSNPFYDATKPRAAKSRVWALGLRQPFRMTIRPNSGSHDPADGQPGALYIGEVGWDNTESLKLVTGPGQNLGWPLFEGLELTPTFSDGFTYNTDINNQDATNALCGGYFSFRQLLKQDTTNAAGLPPFNNPCNASVKIPGTIPQFLYKRPVLDWNHANAITRVPVYGAAGQAIATNIGVAGVTVSGAAFKGNCSVGGTWYTGTAFPAAYQDKYYHVDWGQGLIKSMVFTTNNQLVSVGDFATAGGAIVSLVQHPTDGSFYYVTYNLGDAGTVRRIAYTGNRTPVAVAVADGYYGPGPLIVQFNGSGSSDPDGQSLSYLWDFGDGSAASALANPAHVFNAPGSAPTNYLVTLTVTDSGGLPASTTLNIALNDTPPDVALTSPTNATLYSMASNTTFNLTATVNDVESPDNKLQYLWQSVLHHNDHDHVVGTSTNHASSTLLEPIGCDGVNAYYYRVILTVTDPQGLATVREARLFPNCGPTDTPPAISAITDQATTLNVPTAPIPFTIGDAQVAAANLQLSAASSNPVLVPANNIVFGGFGANRTVTVTPAANLNGTATITVTVNDGPNNTSDVFLLTVTGSNTPPTITGLVNQATPEGTPTATNAFTIGDANTVADNLVLSGWASNPALVPANNFIFGGSGPNRTVSVIPAAGQAGTTTITVAVGDGQLSASNSFNLTVTSLPPGARSVTNATAIAIPDASAGLPYPSVINITGLGGAVTNVTLTLRSLSHSWGRDIDALLVGPGGQKLMFMSDAGTGPTVTNGNLIFSDAAAGFLPQTGYVAAGTYKPTDYEPGDAMPAPAPAGPYATNLSVFNGQIANGPWSLYVVDDGPGDTGSIAGGWSLSVATAATGPQPPAISAIADLQTPVNTPTAALLFTISDTDTPVGSLILTSDSSNPALVPTNNIVFGGSGSNRTVTVTPVGGQTGTATISIFVSDGTNTAADTFVLTVNPPAPQTQSFTNAVAIAILDNNAGSPYPSTINVTGVSGTISNVTLTLRSLSHQWGRDIDALLVGPGGQKVMFMSDAGTTPTATNANFTFADSAASYLPQTGSLLGGTYRPTDYEPGDVMAAPAPTGPYATNFSAFIGQAANGAWSLYVVDDGPGDAGSIAGGWSLTIASVPAVNASPVISAISNQVTVVNTAMAAIPFTISDAETAASNLVLTAASSNPGLVPTNKIVFAGSGTNRTVTVTPTSNQLGSATISLSVSDGTLTVSNSFVLTVNPALLTVVENSFSRGYGATNPVLSGSIVGLQAGDNVTANFTTAANTNSPVGAYAITFTFSDPGSKLGNYVITTNNGTLTVTNALLTVTASGTNKVYGATLNPTAFSTAGLLNGDAVTNVALSSAGSVSSAAVGSYAISASGAAGVGLTNYTIGYGNGTLTVGVANLRITAGSTNKVYGTTLNPAAFSATGQINGDSVTNVTLTSVGSVSNAVVGSYAITASAAEGVGLTNYSIGYSNGTLVVTQALLVARADNKSRAYGQPNPGFTISYIGFVNGEGTNVLDVLPGAGSAATDTSAPGNYDIAVTGGADNNYLFNRVAGTLAIAAPGPVSITTVEFIGAGSLRIAGAGDAQVSYKVQASADLVDWSELGTAVADGGGAFEFVDVAAGGFTARYYRIAMP